MSYQLPKWRRAFIWLKNYWYVPVLILGTGVFGVLLFAAFPFRRNTLARKLLGVQEKLDSRREKVDAEVLRLESQAELDIQRVEMDHRTRLDSLQDQQQAEYEKVRTRGPRAVARWLNDFDKRVGDGSV